MPTALHPVLRSRREIAQHYLGDLIYGANDGIVTTFAIVAGVAGAELSAAIVLILGFSNIVADGFSMAASNYLAIRSRSSVEMETTGIITEPYPLRHASATFAAFIAAGCLPLLAYLLPIPPQSRFATASVFAAVALFSIGASRSLLGRQSWWASGLEMLALGGTAASVAYLIGHLLSGAVA